MKSFTGTWSVVLALLANVGIVVLLFLVIPAEVREKVFRTAEGGDIGFPSDRKLARRLSKALHNGLILQKQPIELKLDHFGGD